MQELALSSAAQRVYVERLVAFAYERESALDGYWVDSLAMLSQDRFPVVDLFAALTQGPSFRVRAQAQ